MLEFAADTPEATRTFANYALAAKHIFKIMALEDYTGGDNPSPQLIAWLGNEPEKSLSLEINDRSDAAQLWIDICQSVSDKEGSVVRILGTSPDFPQTPSQACMRYLLAERNAKKLREDVHELPIASMIKIAASQQIVLPQGEITVFDRNAVMLNKYDDEGNLVNRGFIDSGRDGFSKVHPYFNFKILVLASLTEATVLRPHAELN